MSYEGNTEEENNGYVVCQSNGSTDQLRNRMVVTLPASTPFYSWFLDRYLKTT